MRKKVAILGSTGSIGQQTLEVIRKYSNEFEVVGLSGWENTASLKEQISLFRPKVAVVKNEYTVKKLKKDLGNSSDIKLLCGTEGLVKISTLEEADIIVVAITQQRSDGSSW